MPSTNFTRALMGALFVVSAALVAGCGSRGSVPDADDSAPCDPKTAPFAKVMNPSMAKDYTSCVVKTEAEFLQPNWGGMVGSDIEGYVKWSAVAPGAGTPTFGGFGVADLNLMLVPKEMSDLIFTLKKGDRVTITGTTNVSSVGQVIFFAKTISASSASEGKSAPPAPSAATTVSAGTQGDELFATPEPK